MTATEFKRALARDPEAAMHGVAAYGDAEVIVVEQKPDGRVVPLASASMPGTSTGVIYVLRD